MDHDPNATTRPTLAATLRPVLSDLAAAASRPNTGFFVAGSLAAGTNRGVIGASQATIRRIEAVGRPDPDADLIVRADERATALADAWCRRLLADIGGDGFTATFSGVRLDRPGPPERPATLPQIGHLIRAACWGSPAIDWARTTEVEVMIGIRRDEDGYPTPLPDGFNLWARLYGADGKVHVAHERACETLRSIVRPAIPALRAAIASVTEEINGSDYAWRIGVPSAHQRMEAARALADGSN